MASDNHYRHCRPARPRCVARRWVRAAPRADSRSSLIRATRSALPVLF